MELDRVKHVIEFDEDLADDRAEWRCDCGAAGWAPSGSVDVAAERHLGEGESVSYRWLPNEVTRGA